MTSQGPVIDSNAIRSSKPLISKSVIGRIGLIPSYKVLDAVFSYDVSKWNSRFNFSIKNLTDERFITSRRPQSIGVGIPRFITAGYEFRF